MHTLRTIKLKLLTGFMCLVIVLGLGVSLLSPSRVLAATCGNQSLPSGVDNGCDVTQINIELAPHTSRADTSLTGDSIKMNANTYLLVNASGTVISVLPSSLEMTIQDTGEKNTLPTYLFDSSSGYYYQSDGQSSPPTISGNQIVYTSYASYFDQLAYDQAHPGAKPSYTFNICSAAENVTTTCIHDDLNNADENGGTSLYVAKNPIQGSLLLPLPSSYTPPPPPVVPSTLATISPLTSTDGSTATTCETSDSPLTWILCPVFNMASDFSQWALSNIVQPFLQVSPVSTSPSNGSYKAWSQFRVYGDIFLVIALLIIVFGEVIGGGIIDAYTAKKMLPRILLAAILINLSIYIVAILVDITNIVGNDVSNLLLEPFKSTGQLNFQLNGSQQVGAFSLGILGAFIGSASAAGFVFGFLGGAASFVGVALEAGLFLVLPLILGAVAVFFTMIARQGIILFLIIISPVAFALYCLPNTEQHFRRWWKLLSECLLVYPIVMIIFAVADILSMTILQANNVNLDSSGFIVKGTGETLAAFTAFLLQFVPLLAAPFAFRIAGGTLGKMHELVTNGTKTINQMAEGRRAVAKRKYNARALQGRSTQYTKLQEIQSNRNHNALTRGLARFGAGRVGGYNLEHAASITRADWAKEMNDQIAAGKDDEIRGLSVNKTWALRQQRATRNADGTWTDGQWRMALDNNGNETGVRQFKSLGGGWVNEADVDTGQRRWGRNSYAQQASLAYEMRKASSESELQNLATNYRAVAQGKDAAGASVGGTGWNMTDDLAGGAWIGAAFEHQNQHLEFKHSDWKSGNVSKAREFVNEVYEKKGSYPMAQMGSNTIEQLKNAHTLAVQNGDIDQQEKIRSIAETFMHEMGSQGVAAVGEDGTPTMDANGNPRRQASTPGAAHVAERARELAVMTGIYAAGPTGPYTDPNHAPTPNRTEQK